MEKYKDKTFKDILLKYTDNEELQKDIIDYLTNNLQAETFEENKMKLRDYISLKLRSTKTAIESIKKFEEQNPNLPVQAINIKASNFAASEIINDWLLYTYELYKYKYDDDDEENQQNS